MHYVWRWLISTIKPVVDSLPCQTHTGGRLRGVGWSVGGDSPGAWACWVWNSPEWTFGSGWCKQGRPWRQRCVDRQLLCNLSVCRSQRRPPAMHTESHLDFNKQNYSQSGSCKIKTFLPFIFLYDNESIFLLLIYCDEILNASLKPHFLSIRCFTVEVHFYRCQRKNFLRMKYLKILT